MSRDIRVNRRGVNAGKIVLFALVVSFLGSIIMMIFSLFLLRESIYIEKRTLENYKKISEQCQTIEDTMQEMKSVVKSANAKIDKNVNDLEKTIIETKGYAGIDEKKENVSNTDVNIQDIQRNIMNEVLNGLSMN